MTSEVIALIIVAMTMIVALVAMLATASVAKARTRRWTYRCERMPYQRHESEDA